MNVQTVAENLRRTISGKEALLTKYEKDTIKADDNVNMAIAFARVEFLKINIRELKKILADVESCVAKDVEQSWRDNPDRSGGQFTQDEINRAGEWR